MFEDIQTADFDSGLKIKNITYLSDILLQYIAKANSFEKKIMLLNTLKLSAVLFEHCILRLPLACAFEFDSSSCSLNKPKTMNPIKPLITTNSDTKL